MGISDVKTGGYWSGCEALFRPAVFQGQCGHDRVKGLVLEKGLIYLDNGCAPVVWSLLDRTGGKGGGKERKINQ